MAKRCDLCGRGPRYGNRVSHAHNITRRRWHINLQRVRVRVGGTQKRLRVCTACLRSGRVQKAA
jgi:large subunit ribosomal protein L28